MWIPKSSNKPSLLTDRAWSSDRGQQGVKRGVGLGVDRDGLALQIPEGGGLGRDVGGVVGLDRGEQRGFRRCDLGFAGACSAVIAAVNMVVPASAGPWSGSTGD